MSAQALPTPQKIEELESLRGLAAFLVVFFHIPKWNPILDIGIINNGYLMVELFFVLSGFVIFNAYSDKIDCRTDLLRFQFLRFSRLYPVHIIFLLAFVLIELVKYVAVMKLGISSPNSAPFETNNIAAFIKNIFLISSVLPYQSQSFNYPAWSISVEFYTYLIFGLSILLGRRVKNTLFALVAVAALVMLATEVTFGFTYLLRCFSGFFVGCLTANVTKNLKLRMPSYISLALLAVIVVFLQLKTTKDFDLLIYFLTAALIASLVLSQEGFLKTLLNLKALTWLGAVSYSVYMSHAAIVWATNQVIRVISKRPEIIGANGKSYPQLSQLDSLIACVVVVLCVLLTSALVYNFIEKPIREKSRRFAFSKLS